MNKSIQKYMSAIGRRGGRVSRRRLEPEEARRMVGIREARRAFRKFRAQCFWSTDPGYRIGASDVAWVAEQLMKQGGREAWAAAARLRRFVDSSQAAPGGAVPHYGRPGGVLPRFPE